MSGAAESIAARFAALAARQPDALALVGEGDPITYGALAAEAEAIAAVVHRHDGGAHPERPVAIVCAAPREIAALLGVLWAGRAYCVLDPQAPAAARAALLDDLWPDGAGLALDDARLDDALAPARVSARSGTRVMPRGDPDALAAIVYTSGSSGRPKGVMRRQRAILHRARLQVEHHGVGPGDRLSHLHACRFVAAEGDVFGALLNGATVARYDLQRRGLGPLAAWLRDAGVSHFHPPVAIYRRLLASLARAATRPALPALRFVALAGEALFGRDVAATSALLPGVRIEHRYSSSEAGTIAVHVLDPARADLAPDAVVPVGHVVAGKQVRLVDRDGADVPDGDAGEVVIVSDALASGYWREPDDQRFRDGAFASGDLARRDASGMLTYLGRADRLVKIRGSRVSLVDVEATLCACAGVREAAARVVNDGLGEPCLAAWVVGDTTPAALRAELSARVAAAMLPTRLAVVAELPLTDTGKVDRLRLRTPTAP